MKKKLALLLSLMMIFSFTVLTACGGSSDEAAPAEESAPAAEETTAETAEDIADAAEHGYAGNDPIEAEVYEYVADELSEGYPDAEYNIPIVSIIGTDDSNASDILVWGDFWVLNYNGEGDTLKAASGGNYPGLIHLKKDGDEYEVVKMDTVADGGNFESSAKEIFGDKYDAFMKALWKIYDRLGKKHPRLSDYIVKIPPGGKTDALVETSISWDLDGWSFKTRGIDSDQTEAAIKATLKMLNIIEK